ncbi:hypothetical protein ES708_25188 [subsurface metagenome]
MQLNGHPLDVITGQGFTFSQFFKSLKLGTGTLFKSILSPYMILSRILPLKTSRIFVSASPTNTWSKSFITSSGIMLAWIPPIIVRDVSPRDIRSFLYSLAIDFPLSTVVVMQLTHKISTLLSSDGLIFLPRIFSFKTETLYPAFSAIVARYNGPSMGIVINWAKTFEYAPIGSTKVTFNPFFSFMCCIVSSIFYFFYKSNPK